MVAISIVLNYNNTHNNHWKNNNYLEEFIKIEHHKNIAPEAVEVEGARGVTIQWLISSADGAPNFARFVVEPDGHTPYHSHAHDVHPLREG